MTVSRIFRTTVVDAPARTYENILFHDNYFQNLNFIAYGEPVGGAYMRELTNLDGGYEDFTGSHSDVHLWYHGTLDLDVPTDDSVATITATERENWWTGYESFGGVAGFHYSLIGRGDRTSTARPEERDFRAFGMATIKNGTLAAGQPRTAPRSRRTMAIGRT